MSDLNGFIIINKPLGWTSFDVVAKIKSLSGQKKIGHAGTLDPLAQGVLVVALGQARFLIDLLHRQPKQYLAQIKLGQSSTTDDREGVKSNPYRGPKPTRKQVLEALKKFVGSVEQVPPNFAALKIRGQKMYDLARRGKKIAKKPRPVRIYKLKLEKYEYPLIEVSLEVGRGVYVRAIARDLGQMLGTRGYLAKLVRTKVGPFSLKQAHSMAELSPKNIAKFIVDEKKVLTNIPQIQLSAIQIEKLAHGQTLKDSSTKDHQKKDRPAKNQPKKPSGAEEGLVAVVDKKGSLLLLAQTDESGQKLKSKKIFDINLRR